MTIQCFRIWAAEQLIMSSLPWRRLQVKGHVCSKIKMLILSEAHELHKQFWHILWVVNLLPSLWILAKHKKFIFWSSNGMSAAHVKFRSGSADWSKLDKTEVLIFFHWFILKQTHHVVDALFWTTVTLNKSSDEAPLSRFPVNEVSGFFLCSSSTLFPFLCELGCNRTNVNGPD